MKLYYHPLSTTCRTIMLFAAESGLALEYRTVDLMTGEHLTPEYTAINPSCQIPVLDDGDFRLTESSAILKYLADRIDSPFYPTDLHRRARVNEMMDWFNTGFYRDFGYGLVYPQLFPHHKRSPDEVQQGTIAWGKEHARDWLRILDENLIGPDKPYLCGEAITLADHFGAPLITIGDIIGCSFAAYPNVERWLKNVKALPTWDEVNRDFNVLVEKMRGGAFEVI